MQSFKDISATIPPTSHFTAARWRLLKPSASSPWAPAHLSQRRPEEPGPCVPRPPGTGITRGPGSAAEPTGLRGVDVGAARPAPPSGSATLPRPGRAAVGSRPVLSADTTAMGGKNKQRTKGNLQVGAPSGAAAPAGPGYRAASAGGSGGDGRRLGREGRRGTGLGLGAGASPPMGGLRLPSPSRCFGKGAVGRLSPFPAGRWCCLRARLR